ncbi:MAG: acyl-CoA dehydrogenase family protein [Xanthomonadales bacterium]|uniref:acyl-CoA dehydrogenase family protein n=1 Tax=Dokdonella sp. TaxID=2291710 RepID=UPI002BEB8E00|nr:acyl-CoA dehydrogenase family protein [Xanthomonadales bacterium]HQV71532.1 acyl-CoA dehydrogenase family protein [Dokdonella sp.]MBK7013315.1 acyl-CoA dehydrogenase family protein [Xanthomonadales bacterium]MBK7211520.1 acyl-CoA dehydrogenase family protein [Xanthomonadales bacterium]MBL0221314.1 acyl-CoA dehydrogenase family protein [Xanthomonadales bacterium]
MANHPTAPVLGNQYLGDRVLQAWLDRALPPSMRSAIHDDLDALGAQAAQAWSEARSSRRHQPELTPFDAWGGRVDRIETTPVWQRGAAIAARYGLVAAGHEPTYAEFARCNQFARVYLQHVASEFYTCPLAMTDGAATALKASGNQQLIERALPRLTSRDPATLWLSGQWMTELTGGSDVGDSETEAQPVGDGQYSLHGRKWFTSAVIGEMALTLARPQGAAAGGDGLALFYLETRDEGGQWNGIRIDRLKDKLGTRELPTAEIHLDGTLATPVSGLDHGVRMITPVLNVTRIWNAVCALATMRRCIALATSYAHQREAFGRRLIDHPLHATTLADMQVEFEAAFQLVFHVSHLLGRSECALANANERALLRLLTPLAKLWTGKLAVRIASETCEAFGGAGYIEDTGIPQLLRDAQVYPIWEGTTNVLALDSLRAIASVGVEPLLDTADALLAEILKSRASASLEAHAMSVCSAIKQASQWLHRNAANADAMQAGARDLAFTLARSMAAALLCRQAAYSIKETGDMRPSQALARFIGAGLVSLPDAGGPHPLDLLDPPH